MIGNAMRLKPIATLTDDGTVDLIDKQIGRIKAMNAITKMLSGKELNTDFPLYSLYTYGIENCEKLENLMTDAGFKNYGRH